MDGQHCQAMEDGPGLAPLCNQRAVCQFSQFSQLSFKQNALWERQLQLRTNHACLNRGQQDGNRKAKDRCPQEHQEGRCRCEKKADYQTFAQGDPDCAREGRSQGGKAETREEQIAERVGCTPE
jgi:hypothetical protein